MNLPRLHTKRLELSPWTLDDIEDFAAMWMDPRVIFWAPLPDRQACMERLQKVIDSSPGPLGWWAIRQDRLTIGSVILREALYAPGRIELGYHLAYQSWGQGLAFEACQRILQYGREDLGHSRFEAIILPGNEPSRSLARRLGFRQIGLQHWADREHELWELRLR